MLFLLLLNPAFAYNVDPFPWNDTMVQMKVLTGTSSDWYDAFAEAAALWYDNPTTHFISLSWDNDNGIGTPNWESEIAGTTNMGDLCGSDACAHLWYGTDLFDIFLTEADIYFNTDQDWTTGTIKTDSWAYGGDDRPLVCTALHEMGHALGLQHEADVYNIMGSDWNVVHTNGSTARCEVGSDAMHGLGAAYGWTVPARNIGLSHWRRTGASGEYSTHSRTRIFNSAGSTLTNVAPAGSAEPIYRVVSGQTIRPEYTIQGVDWDLTDLVTIRFYLSSNSFISTSDTLLGSTVVQPAILSLFTTNTSLTLPSSLRSGSTWWVGAIADPTGAFSEEDEVDNAIYISQIQVQ